ncbi:MAG: UDP-2,3-diacylglucosamine diphosphatase [Bacteroidota bacterium]|jgi:UDP-2,3-diacylglucosamine hydrolase
MIPSGKKIYFLSDFHLGAPDKTSSRIREKNVIDWLDRVSSDASEIYLLGDVFDFWFEYKTAVPKGYTRLLGKLASLTDSGIKLHYFTGNHDMWVFDYFPEEIGCTIYREPIVRDICGKRFYIGHGDGLGPGDHGYKFIKKVFANRLCQWLFRWLHPDFGIPLANFFSKRSRIATGDSDEKYLGDENEWLVQYCKELLKKEYFDYLIFGHRHLPIDMVIDGKGRYVNLGEWISHNTFASFDGTELKLERHKID